jgi:hypothetical protein
MTRAPIPKLTSTLLTADASADRYSVPSLDAGSLTVNVAP